MSVNYRAELTGCFGDPVDENPTGVVMEMAYEKLGLHFRYLTVQVREGNLREAVAGARAMNFQGFNLTIPHKVQVIPYLDFLTDAATLIGAVNTVVCQEGGMFLGENTDGKGFLKSLQDAGVATKGRQVTILGAGGAARAIAVELALAGASSVTIVNRSEERGRDLSELIATKTMAESTYVLWCKGVRIPAGTDLLVQCTNIGLYPKVEEIPDIDFESITKDMVCCDVVFNDPNTRFLQEAGARGVKTINGLGMLVNQAALNFTLWTGKEAPLKEMEEVLKREFGLD